MEEVRKSVKVILIRHGQTHFNKQNEELAEIENTMSPVEYRERRKEMSVSQCDLLLNTQLTDTGIAQCQGASETLTAKYPQIKAARISPLRRVIQTFENCMDSHPNFENLDIKFNENLREVLWSNSDVAIWHAGCNKSIKYKEKYDWDFLEKYHDPKFWFLENCTLEKYIEACVQLESATSDEEKLTLLLEYMFETYEPEEFESYKHCYLRVDKAKDQIRQLCIDEGYKDGELLIVAHGNTIKNWTATGLNENWKCVQGVVKPKNCEIFEYELDLEGSKVKLPEVLLAQVFPILKI